MNTHTRFLLGPVCGLLLGLPAVAQEPVARQAPPKPSTVSVDFGGGTLTEFAAALRKAGQNVNIVVPETASKVKVPALVLKETSVEAALRAVTMVVDPGVALAVEISLGVSPGGQVGEPVYSVRVRGVDASNVLTTTPGAPQMARAVRVFATRHLTKPPGGGAALDIKTILTAVDTGLAVAGEQAALDTGGNEQKALVRYHEDSGLLFVAGTSAQLRVVDETVSNLSMQLVQERASSASPPTGGKPGSEPATEEKKKASR